MMLRYVFLIVNALILILGPSFQSGEGVSVTNAIPTMAKPGSTFNVDITIKKGTISGFAKLQQELPAGFTASAGEGKGGTFTFVDQKVKFVWVSLPGDAEFQISYKVTVAADASGPKAIGGTFSYLENNESRKYNVTTATVNVGSDTPPEPTAAAPTATPPTTTPDATATNPATPAQTNPAEQASPAPATSAAVVPPAAGVSSSAPSQSATSGLEIIRTMPATLPTSQSEFTVELTMKNPKLSGFAKIQENLPEGFTAVAVDAKGSTFTFAEQKVKFVWMSLPADPEIKLSYKVTVASGVSGPKSIDGLFSYLENSDSKKYTVTSSTINIGGGDGPSAQANTPATNAAATPGLTTQPATTVPESTATTTPNTGGTAISKAPGTAGSSGTGTSGSSGSSGSSAGRQAQASASPSRMGNIPAPVSGIEFKIQVCAVKRQIPDHSTYFNTTYSFQAPVNMEMHEGWHKYTAGSFPYYYKARDYRNDAWAKGINGSFVVAYNSGTRITVQEALLITKQKWVQ